MAEENQALDLEGKSLEDLEQLEDAIVAESGEDQGKDPNADNTPPPLMQADGEKKPADPPAEPPKPDADPDDPPLPAEAKGEGDDAGDDPPLPPAGDQPAAGDPEPQKTEAEIREHISPPSKWAKMRHEKNELQERLTAAEAKAAEADHLKASMEQLQSEMTWMKSALAGRDVKVPTDPTTALSDERLTEIQDEFGTEMADSFRAVRALLGSKAQPPAPAEPGAQPTGEAPPAPAQGDQPAGDQPEDPEIKAIQEAMQKNDHLMYWSEEKPELLQRAIIVDAAWLKHPQYLTLPYEKRFEMVVKQVQDEEVAKQGALAATKQGGDADQDVPASLSGSGGEAPTQGGMTPADRVLAAPTPEKQEEIYQTLTESERDQVDMELGI
jgi:hypothetical protein